MVGSARRDINAILTNGLPQPIEGERGASVMRPHNSSRERENPDLLASPESDYGTIPALEFPFAAALNRLLTGGLGASGHRASSCQSRTNSRDFASDCVEAGRPLAEGK
jgi:hypothetical protein